MNQRQLDPAEGIKPLDFGAGGITGSVNQEGRLIALNAYHPRHGYFTLTSAPPFPEHERYNPAAVRAYRRSLAELEGFGLHFDSPIVKREVFLLADAIPQIRLTLENGITAEVTMFIPVRFPHGLVQFWRFSETGVFARLTGKFWLQRSAYTQLTEGGPIPTPSPETTIYYHRPLGLIGIENKELGAAVELSGYGVKERTDGSIEFTDESFTYPHLEGQIVIPDNNCSTLIFSLGVNQAAAASSWGGLFDYKHEDLMQETIEVWQLRWQNIPDDLILRRGLSYSLMCCVPIEDDATCILTDHMLLPLSWNRDAYYAALALLYWKIPEATEQVRRHLVWMFEKAERIDDHFWGRSYLANGRIKDRGFQLDQQLFPLLELADYVSMTGDQATLSRLQKHIEPLLGALLARKADHAALFPTDETPADDPIAYPYHFSSHLLFWYMLKRLDGVLQPVGTDLRVCPPDLNENAGTPGSQDKGKMDKHIGLSLQQLQSEIHEAIQQHFVAERNGKRLYSYATDGKGHHHFYQDANDIPVALAPAWGFCAADDAIWRATIDFAFSPDNKGGYYHGRLGSVHTPAAWPLGDVQDLIIARTIGDEARIENALGHLQQAAQWDGALPEAYDPETGEVVSRHWFVWPNAAYACTILGAFDL